MKAIIISIYITISLFVLTLKANAQSVNNDSLQNIFQRIDKKVQGNDPPKKGTTFFLKLGKFARHALTIEYSDIYLIEWITINPENKNCIRIKEKGRKYRDIDIAKAEVSESGDFFIILENGEECFLTTFGDETDFSYYQKTKESTELCKVYYEVDEYKTSAFRDKQLK